MSNNRIFSEEEITEFLKQEKEREKEMQLVIPDYTFSADSIMDVESLLHTIFSKNRKKPSHIKYETQNANMHCGFAIFRNPIGKHSDIDCQSFALFRRINTNTYDFYLLDCFNSSKIEFFDFDEFITKIVIKHPNYRIQ